jgi:hypothetical protein
MDFWYYLNQGGAIIYVLIALNLFGTTLIIWRSFGIYQFKKQKEQYIQQFVSEAKKEKLGRDNASVVIIKDRLSDDMRNLETGLNTIKIIATIAPPSWFARNSMGNFECLPRDLTKRNGRSCPICWWHIHCLSHNCRGLGGGHYSLYCLSLLNGQY